MNVTTLENLPDIVRENRMKQLGENIVKYQKFKISAILNKIDYAGFSKSTLNSYITSGINYIKTGKKYKQYGSYYKYIDEAIERHVQPLTPKQEERRLERNTPKLNTIINTPKVINKNQVKQEENNENKFLAVQINDSFIITMDTEKDINTLISLLKYFSNITCKVVDIKIDSRRKENEIHS